MLKRTKYRRLRSDSGASSSSSSVEERPTRAPSLEDSNSHNALLGPGGTVDPHVSDVHRCDERFCAQSLVGVTHRGAPSCMKRAVSLQRTTGSSQSLWRSPCTGQHTADRVVHHDIKYVGSVVVTQSMRTLDFKTRIQVTREAIGTLRERTSGKATVKTKRSKGLPAVLGQINLQFSGRRILLAVSTDSVTVMIATSLQKIAHHLIPAISFASGGDPDMGDYIAYVARDLFNQRACHILECPHGRAREVMDSIGQAFQRRFRQLLSQMPSLLSTSTRPPVRLCHKRPPEEQSRAQKSEQEGKATQLWDYYNVIPGTAPPLDETELLHVLTEPSTSGVDTQTNMLYQNCSTTNGRTASPSACVESESGGQQFQLLQRLLQKEDWFHGRLGREQAESLLTCSGDFLVRESSSASGQYVLSGMDGGTARHLLLVDAHGQVRTQDQVFLSIGHLVRFHMENQLPIVSGSRELYLKQPILQN
ncbi:SHC-transforming protein 1-like [Nelusetta ayraudi]|uniref:SHC-transforming protein 1-like n=1 Tax=Nelusetta ayraudi TaxID=303726 RepID=UPI003F6F9459